MVDSSLPWWRPERFARKQAALAVRQRVLRAMRRWFEAQDFAEVETPALQVSPGNEAHLHAFATRFVDRHGGEDRQYHLHTSPEFAMKKLLVAGVPRLFQMARVFRNGERSARHQPEFTMLEWYRAGVGLAEIEADCEGLVRAAAMAAGVTRFEVGGVACDPFAAWERVTVADAFMRYAGIELAAVLGDLVEMRDAVARAGLRVTGDEDWDDLFFRVMGERIEPRLGRGAPVFLCDYPAHQAALARRKRGDARWAERFELYICGYEIANAFDELTDAEEQLWRFTADMDLKERVYGERYPVDADFIAALRFGMPEASGIALGFDRLVMMCCGTGEIGDVVWCPVD